MLLYHQNLKKVEKNHDRSGSLVRKSTLYIYVELLVWGGLLRNDRYNTDSRRVMKEVSFHKRLDRARQNKAPTVLARLPQESSA